MVEKFLFFVRLKFLHSFLWICWTPYWQNWQNGFLWMFKIASVEVRKRKNLVSFKKRTLFLQNISVDTWIAIFSKLAKRCRKTFKQDLLQIRIREIINISEKAVFFSNQAPPDNWNAVLNILPKCFYKTSGRNFCINREKTPIFEKKCFFFRKKSSSDNVGKCLRSPAGTFYSQSDKTSVIKLLFKKNVFPQKFDLAYNVKFWQLCWSFLSNLKSKLLKIRSYWVRSVFSKNLFSINCSLGHKKCTFVNCAVKFSPKIRKNSA